MKIAFYTLGCKVNQYETQYLREAFCALGHTVVSDDGLFDVAVINSCTVTAESDRKTRQLLRRIRRENPNCVILLTGCMVQAFSNNAQELTEADIIVGNTDVKRTVELTEQFLRNGEKIFEVIPHKQKASFNTPNITDFAERTRAYMKIEDGCDRYCSYCIIPKARGFVRSKSVGDIETEAALLAKKGFSEIVLVGINLSAYGKGEGKNLCDAVEAVAKIDGIKRVRLGSLEPDHISDDMLKRLKSIPKFCPQFHLSLQSGCDETLKRMNRHYDTKFYSDLVNRIRNMFEDASITTDIMVGFAGETEEEFKKSLEYLKEIGFAKAHVFAYSRRSGTVAYQMPNQITKQVKADRSNKMLEAAAEAEKRFYQSHINKTVSVLFEDSKNGVWEGYTPNYLRVCVKTQENLQGKILNVKITAALNDCCEGIIETA